MLLTSPVRAITTSLLLAGSASRCGPPQAVVGEAAMDPHAALGCFCSLAPVILSLHWGWTMNEASDRYKIAKLEEEAEYLACLRGDGCPIAYELCKDEVEEAAAELEAAKQYAIAGASRAVFAQATSKAVQVFGHVTPTRRSVIEPATMATSDEADDELTRAFKAFGERLKERK